MMRRAFALVMTLFIAAAQATVPPPLPAWQGAAVKTALAQYDVPPLPEGAPEAPANWVANPFLPDNGGADKTNAANAANETAPPNPASAAALAEPLEGPPTPLPAMARLSDVRPGDDGLPPDRPISLNFQRAELTAVLHAFAQFTKLNIVASERVRG